MKIKILLLLALLNYGFSNAQIPTNGLTKAYTFSNLNLTNVANPGTYDLVASNTNNAVASTDPASASNEAIDLNGTAFNAGLHPTGSGSFTISFWIKTGANGTTRIIDQLNTTTTNRAGYFINLSSNGTLNFSGSFRYGSNYSTFANVSSNAVNDNTWHHIVVTGELIRRTQTFPSGPPSFLNSYRYTIYQDNVSISTANTSELVENATQQVFLFSNSPNLTIGGGLYQNEFDNYREYTRLLTVSEIADLFREFGALSVDDFQSTRISLYPNPVKNVLNIKSDFNIKSIIVYNLQAQKLIKSNNRKIDVALLPTGTYLAKITTSNGNNQSFKFIKK